MEIVRIYSANDNDSSLAGLGFNNQSLRLWFDSFDFTQDKFTHHRSGLCPSTEFISINSVTLTFERLRALFFWYTLIMKYRSIFIANLSEIARPLVKLMNKERAEGEVWEDHWLCDRFLFSEVDDRILITPVPIEKDFFEDACRLMGYKNTVNWWPEKVGESISEAILKDKQLLEKIVREIKPHSALSEVEGLRRGKGDGGIKINSYAATPEFMKLVGELRDMGLAFETPEIPEEKNRWVAGFFGSKAGFRQAIASLGKDFPAMPQGGICSNKEETIGWASYLLRNTAGCVIKANRGLAGAGLRIIKREEVRDVKNIREYLKRIIESERYWSFSEGFSGALNAPNIAFDAVVVEEYIPADMSVCGGNPNIELMIPQDGRVKVLYPCGMWVTPEGNFRGIEFGKGAVQKEAAEILTKSGRHLGEYLEKMGYRGYFEIDYIPRSINEIYPIEANLRRTGGTHAYELALRLLGKDFTEHYYVTTNNLYDTPGFKGKSYLELKGTLRELLYPIKGQKEGVILTIINLLQKGQLGYVVVGESKERVAQIEKEFLGKI